jgi:hypothetical protein
MQPDRPSAAGRIGLLRRTSGLRDTALVLCQQRPLHVGESDPLTAQPIEQSVVGLKEFDDDPVVAMNPTSRDHQQK